MTPVSSDKNLDLTVTRIIKAPRSLVWRAWTEPEHLEKRVLNTLPVPSIRMLQISRNMQRWALFRGGVPALISWQTWWPSYRTIPLTQAFKWELQAVIGSVTHFCSNQY